MVGRHEYERELNYKHMLFSGTIYFEPKIRRFVGEIFADLFCFKTKDLGSRLPFFPCYNNMNAIWLGDKRLPFEKETTVRVRSLLAIDDDD